MTPEGKTKTIASIQYYLGLIVLILSLISTAVSIGYFVRRIDDHERRINAIEVRQDVLEKGGSTTAKVTANDVQWIINSIKDFNTKIDRVEQKIDRHMRLTD